MKSNVANLLDKNKDYIAVVGLGKTGLSCIRFLKGKGFVVKVTDSRAKPPGFDLMLSEFSDVELFLGEFSEAVLMNAQKIILSPGVSLKEPAIQKAQAVGVPVVGDIELFCAEIDAPIIAITGSNAKSTVTDLVGRMMFDAGLHVCVGGNLGTPALSLLGNEAEVYVLELSSFQLETTHALNAVVATILNISEDHLDRYDHMLEYQKAKYRIFRGCKKAVLNRDDSLSSPLLPPSVSQITFGAGIPGDKQFGLMIVEGETYLAFQGKPIFPQKKLHIAGLHNALNALAALAIGYQFGLSIPVMINTLSIYHGLPHRCQWVTQFKGVDWYNDSKGTNVGATLAAIKGLGESHPLGKIVLIAGGVGKGADFTSLQAPLHSFAREVILMGKDAPLIYEAIKNHTACYFATNLRDAVQRAALIAEKGDSVLLSPACASFDMFSGYEERGDQFVKAVFAEEQAFSTAI